MHLDIIPWLKQLMDQDLAKAMMWIIWRSRAVRSCDHLSRHDNTSSAANSVCTDRSKIIDYDRVYIDIETASVNESVHIS